jgi:hypothetical protein
MRRPRFTIGNLLVLVLFLAVGLAALRAASEGWDSAVFGLTLLVMLASVLLAVHRDGPRRAYWLGFALFGWTYLALLEIPSVAGRLPTAHALAYIDSLVPWRTYAISVQFTPTLGAAAGTPANPATPAPGMVSVITTSPTGSMIQGPNAGPIRVWNLAAGRALGGPGDSTEHFIRIGHSLLALILAYLGAFASRSLYLRERRGSAPTTIDPEDVQETSTSSPTS